jgi:hypothetical protein
MRVLKTLSMNNRKEERRKKKREKFSQFKIPFMLVGVG